ncbi:MAG: peptidase C26 [Planctomycetaceae bacterium]|nr:peptidase C26 [Planctomycetaceae bacterium]
MPLIGITTYGQNEERHFTIPREYVDCVRRSSGTVVLIPPGVADFDGLLEHLDGVILAGGGDLDPQRYAGREHETIYMLDAERDETELALARRVIDSGLPTLGICRGTQVINVVLGGTLMEHLPDEVGESVVHRLPPREPTEHCVRVQEGTQLADILRQEEFSCASWHHQAIRDVAQGLNVSARAEDGVVEAVEMPAHAWLIAVQWHPELTAASDRGQQRLFEAFVQACRES